MRKSCVKMHGKKDICFVCLASVVGEGQVKICKAAVLQGQKRHATAKR